MRASVALVAIGIGLANGANAQARQPHWRHLQHYTGTRHVRYDAVPVGNQPAEHYDDEYDVSDDDTETRFGDFIVRTEMRHYSPQSGEGRDDAVQTERLDRHEQLSSGGQDVRLTKLESDRTTFGYARLQPFTHTPFDGVDHERIVETYDSPALIWTERKLRATRNDIARSSQSVIASLSDSLDRPDGMASQRIESDGAVLTTRQQLGVSEQLDQHPSGSAKSYGFAPGFYTAEQDIGAPERSGNSFAIELLVKTSGRAIGGPAPVVTKRYSIPDWYPGGERLRRETDLVESSGAADMPVPEACGTNARRRAHQVLERKICTRVDGTNEDDSNAAYAVGSSVVCVIERRRTRTYDLETGQQRTSLEMVTILKLADIEKSEGEDTRF